MKPCVVVVFAAAILSTSGFAQDPPVNSPLLDRLAGKWISQVSIGGQTGTHDIDAKWVLDHHYLRLHEVSREKDAKGNPQYEAMVFIASNRQNQEYACAWLDVFGGLSVQSIGTAIPKENQVPFIFKDESGATVLSNVFTYDPKADSWEWRIDNVDNGKAILFGMEKLTRVKR
ncbi:MAG TPA: hypothetical protein VFB00_02015 [Terriglobales bacterium]|nr:hypothetical protein [Terriglobales bacterium]